MGGLVAELRDLIDGARDFYWWLRDEVTEWVTGEGAWDAGRPRDPHL